MINAIELNKTINDTYIDMYGNSLEYIHKIGHINIFIGENNSGKSRLMRALINSRDATILTDGINDSAERNFQQIKDNIKSRFIQMGTKHPELTLHNNHDQLAATELYIHYKEYIRYIIISNKQLDYYDQRSYQDIQSSLNRLHSIITTETAYKDKTSLLSFTRFYIPVLRGIESFNLYFDSQKNKILDSINMNSEQREALEEYKMNASRIYKNKINGAYNIRDEHIFTGENLFEEIRNKLLGKETDRLFVREFEKFISDNFYDGEGFTIIPLLSEGYLYVKIGNNKERPLHDLGDGIKQLICILYKIFEYRNSEAFFFIEEPEINLHPGYQRKLMNILQHEDFSKLYFFITTHSNHLVDSCFDYDNISIYKFINIDRKNNVFQVINSGPDDIDLLNLLGVNNSSVFMANSTIWVEGISDKIYISKYLQVYLKSKSDIDFKEDIDYSFIEYGGNNITHWAFDSDDDISTINASGITNRSMIILDNDNDSNSKKKRKEKLKSIFGSNYVELPVREIENTIKREVLLNHLFGDNEVKYKKGAENKKDNYETKSAYLWEYIDKHYETSKKYWNSRNKSPNISKMKFAKEIASHITSIDDLSKNALILCEKIHEFLKKSYTDINK